MLLVFNSNNVYNDLNLILDIILMRAINVSEAGALRIYSAIKILSQYDSIVW